MNYSRIHDQIIARARAENRVRDASVYYESHHITPRSLGGSDEDSNLVLLTAREHFIVHWILPKIYYAAGHSAAYLKMCNALNWFLYPTGERDYKITSRKFALGRVLHAEAQRGKTFTPETKQKLSELKRGENNPNFGKTLTPETKQKLSEAKRGKPKSEETKQKISESRRGVNLTPETKQKLSEARRGKTLTPETKQKLSELNRGENNPNFGKTHTPETKQKMSEARRVDQVMF